MKKQVEINRAYLRPGDLVVTSNIGNPWIIVEREVPAPKVGDVLRTEQELDDLPRGAVILDEDGDAWQKRNQQWIMADAGTARERTSRTLADSTYGPFKILHIKEEN